MFENTKMVMRSQNRQTMIKTDDKMTNNGQNRWQDDKQWLKQMTRWQTMVKTDDKMTNNGQNRWQDDKQWLKQMTRWQTITYKHRKLMNVQHETTWTRDEPMFTGSKLSLFFSINVR